MTRPVRLLTTAAVVAGLTIAGTSASAHGRGHDVGLAPIGAYTSPTGEAAAEISAFDPSTDQVYVTNAEDNTLDVLSIADPTDPTLVTQIDLSPYGGGVNSVAVHGTVIAAAIEADEKTDNGSIVLWRTDGTLIDVVEAGALPDMVTFSHNGRYVVAANEGEPNAAYDVDPEGSITVITMHGRKHTRVKRVRHATFDRFDADALRAEGVRIFGPNATAAQDLEPEYITIIGSKAYVTLQENNAIAIVDLARARVRDVVALGTKDHSLPGNFIDASNDDDIDGNLQSWPVQGFSMPDAIASYGGFLFTANEGDAREYIVEDGDDEVDVFVEESNVEDVDLDPIVFPDAAFLQENEQMGNLKVTTTAGDTDGDGDYDELYSFGARSMSVWNRRGDLVWDSGSLLTEVTVAAGTWDDGRADNKGSEPEGVEIGRVGWRTYAFLGLERTSDIVVFDITRPWHPRYVTIVPAPFDAVSPEGLEFVSAKDSPTRRPLLIATYEVTGTTVVYEVG